MLFNLFSHNPPSYFKKNKKNKLKKTKEEKTKKMIDVSQPGTCHNVFIVKDTDRIYIYCIYHCIVLSLLLRLCIVR